MDRLVSPKKTKEIVDKFNFRFSKSLGQNFLIDENILDKIVAAAEITQGDRVIEVGPGIGTLTQALADEAEKVVAIEIDKNLLPILKETLKETSNVEVVHGDVLKLDLHGLIEEKLDGKPVKVIANLPYYVTTPIIMKFFEEKIPVAAMVVMIQKEVADRMQAKPGTKDYGALSVAVQYYSEPQIITKVPRSVFIPQPNVESTVIRLKALSEPKVRVQDEKLMFQIVRAAFGQRRKTLLNALAGGNLGLSKEEIKEILAEGEIEESRRGETLTIEEFGRLADVVYNRRK